jgi:hypothetical protein
MDQECYVCYELCDTPAQCNCKTLYVHGSCITIMKLYGKTECGICKEPYIQEEVEEWDDEWNSAPCCWLIVPTDLRPGQYDVNALDKLCDIVRYMIVAVCLMLLIHLSTDTWAPDDFDEDFVPAVMLFMLLACCCSATGHRLQRQPHNLNRSRNRGTMHV